MNYREFVNEFLIPLTDEKNTERAALADMRRGLSDFPDLPSVMHQHMPRAIQPIRNRWHKQTYYLSAALFASHQLNAEKGNLGSHFHELLDPNPNNQEANKPIERRFTYLLAAHPEDLHFHLRQAVAFLKSKEIAINWEQLMWDIRKWDDPDARAKVQEYWATQFWKPFKSEDTGETQTN